MDYIAIIHKDRDSDFRVSFPDFPGCITAGRTLDEAKGTAREALSGHIQVMREAGGRYPIHPRSMKSCAPISRMGWLSRQRQRPGQTGGVNVTLTEQQLREIDRHARARGMTRSAFLVKAGLQVVDAG
jgi:predicted RNase H-like HicB family nuclease